MRRLSLLSLVPALLFVFPACTSDADSNAGGYQSSPGGTGGTGGTGGSSSSLGGGKGSGSTAGGAGGTSAAGGGGPGGSAGGATPAAHGDDGYFEAPQPWTKDVLALPKSPHSDAITGWLSSNGGWGTGKMRVDFSIEVLTADASAPHMGFTPTDDFYSPDCDAPMFPVPPGGAIEGEQGYQCTSDGDCHLLVLDTASSHLLEMWRANISGGTFLGGCAADWDLKKPYPDNLRGEGCTSADGGGFPIAPLLFSADEVAAGEIKHAIRFILPNARIRKMTYVHPGTHSTFPTSGGADAPPYGVRFRLRSSFPLETLPTEGARVVARALQRYGMFLADGGNIALTARSDRFTQHKWDDVGFDSFSLTSIQVSDMEVVDMGEPILWDTNCVRNPLGCSDEQIRRGVVVWTGGGERGSAPAPPAGRCPCTPAGRCPCTPAGLCPCTPGGALPLHPGQEKRGLPPLLSWQSLIRALCTARDGVSGHTLHGGPTFTCESNCVRARRCTIVHP
jgi:hypothetical protein